MPTKVLCISAIAAGLFLVSSGANGQDLDQFQMLPADRLVTEFNRTEVGKLAIQPEISADRAQVAASCKTTCDAYIPRQPIVTVTWEEQVTPAVQDQVLRLDIAGTPAGFNQGNYGTIRIANVPQFESVVLDPASPLPIAQGQVLLNQVSNNRIVERLPDLPVFSSPDVMARMMVDLDPDLRRAIEVDKLTGALTQVRVLGLANTPLDGVTKQLVTMVGFQPGMTYRVRLVDEEETSAETVFQQICRIPVCPADFVDQ